jgi:hypothetical protein
MLKLKSHQTSGCKHIHQTSQEVLNKYLLARKLMADVFWNWNGVLMVELTQGTTTRSQVHCDIIELRKAI